jgi:hypothetical protein
MIEDIQNIQAQIKCKHNYQKFLNASADKLAQDAIYKIRIRNYRAGLVKKPKERDILVGDPIDVLDRAIQLDPENSRYYARIAVRDYRSRANVERERLQKQDLKDDFEERYSQWEAKKVAAEKSRSYIHPLEFVCGPRDEYYNVKFWEQCAENTRRKYGLTGNIHLKSKLKGGNK